MFAIINLLKKPQNPNCKCEVSKKERHQIVIKGTFCVSGCLAGSACEESAGLAGVAAASAALAFAA